MFEALLAIALLLILILLGFMGWTIHNSSLKGTENSEKVQLLTETMTGRLESINDVLCDLADIAETAPVTTAQIVSNQNQPQSIGELITTLLLNRVTNHLGHASEEFPRTIYSEDDKTQENEFESDGSVEERNTRTHSMLNKPH